MGMSELPLRGPTPWDVHSSGFSKNTRDLPIPQMKAECTRTTAPKVSSLRIRHSYYVFGKAELDYDVNCCTKNRTLPTRVLFFEYVRQKYGPFYLEQRFFTAQASNTETNIGTVTRVARNLWYTSEHVRSALAHRVRYVAQVSFKKPFHMRSQNQFLCDARQSSPISDQATVQSWLMRLTSRNKKTRRCQEVINDF